MELEKQKVTSAWVAIVQTMEIGVVVVEMAGNWDTGYVAEVVKRERAHCSFDIEM